MGSQKPQALNISPIRGGTGAARLAPPWARSQVKWIGWGYYILRLATEGQSRWLLGAGFRWQDAFPHERTFRRSATDKCNIISSLKMNPWPVHLTCQGDADAWRLRLSQAIEHVPPVLDTGHITLWRLRKLPIEVAPTGPFLVLDGHHSRRAQKQLGLKRLFGWIEPLESPQLQVRSIERAGHLSKWLQECIAAGTMRELSQAPDSASWTMDQSMAFEVVQADRRWWCEIMPSKHYETVVDALGALAKGRIRFSTTASFDEALRWLEKFEIDAALRLPVPAKAYIFDRARRGAVFPQKSTYFFPKMPFGLLVQDLQ